MEGAKRAVSRLDLPENVKEFLTTSWGISTLHPPQYEAMPSVLGGNNTLLAIPTASGKSLVAYIGIMKRVLMDEPGSKAVYIVPLKALASEKFDDLSELCSAVGLTVGLGIGDASAEAKKIDECDVLVCTSEKLDSLMRNRSEIMANVSIVVADEFHLMNDSTRGPTLEINLTRLRHLRLRPRQGGRRLPRVEVILGDGAPGGHGAGAAVGHLLVLLARLRPVPRGARVGAVRVAGPAAAGHGAEVAQGLDGVVGAAARARVDGEDVGRVRVVLRVAEREPVGAEVRAAVFRDGAVVEERARLPVQGPLRRDGEDVRDDGLERRVVDGRVLARQRPAPLEVGPRAHALVAAAALR